MSRVKRKTEQQHPKRFYSICSHCGLLIYADKKEQLFSRCNCKTLLTWNDTRDLKSFNLEER